MTQIKIPEKNVYSVTTITPKCGHKEGINLCIVEINVIICEQK